MNAITLHEHVLWKSQSVETSNESREPERILHRRGAETPEWKDWILETFVLSELCGKTFGILSLYELWLSEVNQVQRNALGRHITLQNSASV
jgi:hypothetical protein